MLRSAVLGALPQKQVGFMRIDPQTIRVIRNQVNFARQARDPETMIRVCRKQRKEGWRRMRWVAQRDMELVGRHDLQVGIAILPPKLVTDHYYFKRTRRAGFVLNGRDYMSGRQKQPHDDEDRNHGPRQLHLIASIDLRGLAAVIVVSISELHYRVGKQTEDDN